MYYQRRSRLSQNFLHNPRLVSSLIHLSSIGKKDLVLEIGPGKGIITQQLLNKASAVLAIELDYRWCQYLKKKFKDQNLLLYQANFLEFPLPMNQYKIFANLPFAIEGKAIRKLINAQYPPQDCCLIIRKELAERLTGKDRENRFSLTYKPWFDLSIVHYFKRQDFRPVPKVEAVLFRFTERKIPLLSYREKENYQNFLKLGFGQGLPIYQNLAKKLGKHQAKQLLKRQNINLESKPSWLTLKQWLSLYLEAKRN